jgi:uncharacterized membrane protein YbaN (DUF454 family)
MSEEKWVYCKYWENASTLVEEWVLYEFYYCNEVQSWANKKIYEKDKKIIKGG